MNIKSGFRIALVLGATLTAAAVVAFGGSQLAFFDDTTRNDQLDRVASEGMQLVQLTQEVLLHGEARAIQQWHGQAVELDGTLRSVGSAADPDLQAILDALSIRFKPLRPLLDRLVEARAAGGDARVTTILASQLFQDVTQVQASLRELRAFSENAHRQAYKTSKERQLAIFGSFASLMALYLTAVLVLFHAVILKPLNDLDQTIGFLRQGKPARARGRADDEIGVICQTFNTLLDEQESAREELKAMAERFRNIFEQAAVGMAIISPEGAWLGVNQCLCDILGHSREDFLGAGYQAFASPETVGHDTERVRAILAGERASDSWESGFPRKDGPDVVARITTALARDDAGNPLYFVTVIEDITVRKQAELALNQSNHQLEEQARVLKRANADLESFAWVASHDLREPLRSVSSYVSLIQRRLGPDIDGDLRDFMGYAIEGSKRMYAMIGGLLEYARVGASEEDFQPVAMSEVVAESRANLFQAVEDTGATLVIQDDLPMVAGIPGELVRLFQNLLDNAVKFRHPDRPPEVVVDCAAEGNDWVFRVKDNGIGLDPQYAERIFGMFQRVVPRDQYEGTGIGLSVCKKVTEFHGGRIWVEAAPGQGCCFFVALPQMAPAKS